MIIRVYINPRVDKCPDTYELFEYALIQCLFWLPALVELLVMLFETLEVGLPLLAAVVTQLLDTDAGQCVDMSGPRRQLMQRSLLAKPMQRRCFVRHLERSRFASALSHRQKPQAEQQQLSLALSASSLLRSLCGCTYRSRAHLVTRRPSFRQ